MKPLPDQVSGVIATVKPKLLNIAPENARQKENPDTWSKQEILGHLIDSALNNHQRFVRGAQDAAGDFPIYDQNRWVEVQCYNEIEWIDLVNFFVQYNYHLCRVIDVLPQEALSNPCNIGKETPVTSGFVIEDYLRQLRLHTEQILETWA